MKAKKTNARRILCAATALCMILSLAVGLDLTASFRFGENVSAAASGGEKTETNEYANETLENMWDSDGDGEPETEFLDAARPYYACRSGSYGGVEYRTIFHVYAFEGDTICIGSSVADSKVDMNFGVTGDGKDKGSVDVVMTDLNGVTHAIDIRNSTAEDETETNTTGYIPDWQTEWAAVKYLEKKDGKFSGTYNDGTTTYTYTPYTYTVTETGVYTFEFHSYNKGGTNKSAKRSDSFEKAKSGGIIAALNLTVFDESGVEQHGRTYADFLSLQMTPATTGVVDTYYILTKDSYIYKMKFNDVRPYTYNFFSNNKGIYDSDTREIIYTSVKDTDNDNTFKRLGASYKYPGTKDTDMLKSYYIFLEYPDEKLEGEIYQKAVQPDPAKNLKFISTVENTEGETVPGAYEGHGGYFSFEVDEATTATVRIEITGKDNKKYAPVEITQAVTPHTTNIIQWDGKDGNGEVIPAGEYNINDFAFTVTTKAGEIHFPIIDMEFAPKGITFTRLSHIYDKEGNQLDTDGSIYDLTKNVIYYDDTAIYYGEKVASSELSESDVGVAKGKFNTSDGNGGLYFPYNNMTANVGGEWNARQSQYIKDNKTIRVGDHSHTTNVIEYFDDKGDLITSPTQEQINMINYLSSDTAHYPVGKSSSSSGNSTTTDYAIANFWTFIPAKPAKATATEQTITIVDPPENSFNLTGRVFFDANKNNIFDEMTESDDYPIGGVMLELYKKTTDTSYDNKKKYFICDGSSITPIEESGFATADKNKLYEFVSTGTTTGEGSYKFSGLKYEPDTGTEYLYRVIKPNADYTLNTGSQNAKTLSYVATTDKNTYYYGYYASKSYNNSYTGTEIQHIVVGNGSNQVNPEKLGYDSSKTNESHDVCAVDVGYTYDLTTYDLMLKKTWKTTKTTPSEVAYEVWAHTEKGKDIFFDYYVLSPITAWQSTNQYLPQNIGGEKVNNYFVKAEYYFGDSDYNSLIDTIYKHTFEYKDGNYTTFVGSAYSADISALDGATSFSGIADKSVLQKITWTDGTPPYKAVLDRNISSDVTVGITNSEATGTIEVFKYSGTNEEANALSGATFRVYDLTDTTVDEIKKLAASSAKTDIEKLQKYQVGSGTTRTNGRLAFPGLDPTKDYLVREMYPPAGFRILEEFYEVHRQGSSDGVMFNDENYAKVDVGNAPADSDFYIVKQIEGRAWQDNDKFTFTILSPFDTTTGTIEGADGITLDDNEKNLKYNSASAGQELNDAKDFAKHFKASTADNNNVITVDDSCPYYTYTKNEGGKDVTYQYPDRKKSKDSILAAGEDGDDDAKFCGVDFPFAGEYTFTIKENDLAADSTLTISPIEYTVKIKVTRELKESVKETEPSPPIDMTNSHLVAEVSSITYTANGGASQIFAGSSPVFNNIYKPAPAQQDTSYKITKSFTGREWKDEDEFTVTVSGANSQTTDAIKDGQLSIDGLTSNYNDAKDGWSYTFKKPSTGTESELPLTAFSFKNIEFPVEYVDSTGKVWIPAEHDDAETPPEDDITAGIYTPKTSPVTYWLKIEENIPTETKGITYDNEAYYLRIELRNTEKTVSSGSSEKGEEEDGIIDEIDMELYHADKDFNISEPDTTKLVATCNTVQTVMTKDDWDKITSGKTVTDQSEGDYVVNEDVSKWYVDKDNVLHDNLKEPFNKTDTSGYIFIKRTETHKDKSGTNGHNMLITNVYHTSYSWQPMIRKTVNGRKWLADDEFTFTITAASDNPAGCDLVNGESKEITINNDTEDHEAFFEAIKFTAAGTYNFTITETDRNGTSLGSYTVTVSVVDKGDGTLVPTIKDAAGKIITDPVIEFVNTYSDTDFTLDISKKIIGRDWREGDSFTFNIKPDSVAKTAIDNNIIVMPSGAVPTDGNYNLTVRYGTAIPDNTVTNSFGNITIKNTGALVTNQQYKFTISEETESLESMYCREPNIDLTVTVDSNTAVSGKDSTNTLVATYAHIIDGKSETITPIDGKVTIPFENVATGKLTVAKKVVSSSEKDTQDFDFTVTFTYGDDMTKKDYNIKAHNGTTEIEPKKSDKTWTYTFTLKDGENVEFTDIPTGTSYTVEEKIDEHKDKYMLLRVRGSGEDTGDNLLESGKNSVSGELDESEVQPYLMFVNGKITQLPSAGGKGVQWYILIGALFTAVSLGAVVILRRRKNKEF